jgi:prepilin-type N-terminal cleavage/methylation domain-containing protein
MIASRASNRGFSASELLFVLAIGATLMALGTPVLRGAMGEQRLRAGAAEVSNALGEARREAFRTTEVARVEIDPANGRISVVVWDTATGAFVERRRLFLPNGVVFNNIAAVTNFTFDTLGRPAALPMTVQVRSAASNAVRTVTVLGTGRVTIT